MTTEEIIEKGKAVISIEADAVSNLVNNIDKSFADAVNIIFQSKGRVVLTGLGKSGLIARKIVATLNSTGTPSIYLHPTDALHGDLGMVRKEDIVIIISKSGSTDELNELLLMFKRIEVAVISMTGNLNSKLATESDIILNVGVKEEACPHDLAPTSSTTAALVMGDALAIALLEKRGFTADDFAMLHPAGSLGKRLSLRISEIMHKGEDIPVVKENTPLKDAIFEISSKRLGVTAVINSEGILTGVITDGDLRRLLEKSLEIKNFTAIDVMTKNPKTIQQEYLASFALQTMENYKITSLVIVNSEHKPAGVVHLHELVKLGLQQR
ncbi:MAG: KpsF/GutQ family sugar-phosphate isomerase [Melioribacteraceae bacterium]|nr:KpsF/GutQ family sugar-phosphate isomerase [Melioribacteraceae bacterium]MCF8264300.1 KpsF/GutQ family sugar-phosphate isomerase [Melioribacteraceae bacterium]MCF8412926.1 KpsF/GutQ family sugar-phosphate isomerase [Melioribacteraceae bacterium]MCF8432276.1 KpsF/GutQ family sugar-phosphate isomerase [Melioribacteraceae bacterium]